MPHFMEKIGTKRNNSGGINTFHRKIDSERFESQQKNNHVDGEHGNANREMSQKMNDNCSTRDATWCHLIGKKKKNDCKSKDHTAKGDHCIFKKNLSLTPRKQSLFFKSIDHKGNSCSST